MDFSFAEFAIIGIVALLVIGPDKLPGLARTAGLWVGKVRNFISSVKTEIDAELKMDEIKNVVKNGNNGIHEISEIIRDTRTEFQNSINSISSTIKEDESTPEYQVRAIANDDPYNEEDDDSQHNEVEDDFVDDYNSDYEIDEIEASTNAELDSEAKTETKPKLETGAENAEIKDSGTAATEELDSSEHLAEVESKKNIKS